MTNDEIPMRNRGQRGYFPQPSNIRDPKKPYGLSDAGYYIEALELWRGAVIAMLEAKFIAACEDFPRDVFALYPACCVEAFPSSTATQRRDYNTATFKLFVATAPRW